ncbi:MAG TPA: STAS domain-containing protein [Solirubrobacterales bacterium]|nr:STAS domain-containing protein [Solirubrobacterales bacterium]
MSQLDRPAQTQARPRLFKLSEQRIWPGCIEIQIEGELDFTVSGRLRSSLDAAEATPCHVLLGFAACDFIDSSGLAVLAAADRAFAAREKQLLLYGVRGQVRRLLSVVGMAENGVLAGDAAGRAAAAGETGLGRSFEVALPGGGSARLRRPGALAP